MSKKTIIVQEGATSFEECDPPKFRGCSNDQRMNRVCNNCSERFGAHICLGMCPRHEKVIETNHKTTKCIKFNPKAEKILLRLGIKHSLLVEVELQGSLKKLQDNLDREASYYIMHCLNWGMTRKKISGKNKYLFWAEQYALVRKLEFVK